MKPIRPRSKPGTSPLLPRNHREINAMLAEALAELRSINRHFEAMLKPVHVPPWPL